MTNKYKHLTLDERIQIESLLNQKRSFKSIALGLGRDYAAGQEIILQ